MRVAALIARLAGVALLALPALPALADKFTLDPTEPPLQLCSSVQKNVRFMHNVWDNGARDTFAQMKATSANNCRQGRGRGEAAEGLSRSHRAYRERATTRNRRWRMARARSRRATTPERCA